MRLTTIFFMIVALFQIYASDVYAQKTKITLSLSEVPVEDVLSEIEKRTDFKFLYNDKDVDYKKIVSIRAENQRVSNILNRLFKDTHIVYEVFDRQIILKTENSPSELPSVTTVPPKPQSTVTGQVLDAQGQPLPGANILEKGTDNGTVSDFDGNFSLELKGSNAILEISYLGFLTKAVPVNGQTSLTVQLEEDAAGLDEVVLVGYGTQKKSDLTGAVASVSSEDAKALTVSDPTLALQGRVPGVNVQSNGGGPGSGVSVLIRGAASLTNVDPLYVVDGVFLESLSSINPNDIESIEVLKDASAAAIYGSRAANGVVLVTTKGGKKGLTVNVHATSGITSSINELDLLNAWDYANIRNIIDTANGATLAPANSTAFDPNVDTDWQDLSLRTGTMQDYGFDFSGAGDNSSVYFSGNYYKEKGILVSSDFKRINFRINSEFWSNDKKFKFSENLAITQREVNENRWYGDSGFDIPTLPLHDENGDFVGPDLETNGTEFFANRYARDMLDEDKYQTTEVFGNLAAEYKIFPNLKYRLNVGLNFTSIFDYLYIPSFELSAATNTFNFNDSADLTEARATIFSGLVDNLLFYDLNLGDHAFNFTLGTTYQRTKQRGTSMTVTGFANNDLRTASSATAVTSNTGEEIVSGLLSGYFRMFYNYKDTYFLTSTVRQDKSSRFAKQYRTGTFPSASLGWRVSNEAFFPKNDIVTNLKLRASYGELGSQNVDDYAFSSIMNINSFYPLNGQTAVTGFSQTQFSVPNLVWETSKTTNFGVDVGFLNGQLNLSADYFVRKTSDILVDLSIPPSSGSSNPVTANSASIKNNGFELNLNYKNNESAFNYAINLNVSSYKNEVTSLGLLNAPIAGGTFSNELLKSTRAVEGQPLGVFWGYETEGLYQSQAEIDNDPNLSSDPAARSLLRPGELIWKDQNGDGYVNDDDKVKIGNPFPDFDFGLNFTGAYKRFDFTLFFQGQVGNEIFNARKYYMYFAATSNYAQDILNAWSTDNTGGTIPVVGTSRVDASDYYIENGSYLRLKQLKIGYQVPDFIKGLSTKVFANFQNLLTITGYSGYDPELGIEVNARTVNGSALLSRGVDDMAYPQTIQVMGGIQFTIK